jgi:putative copper resistance protein D
MTGSIQMLSILLSGISDCAYALAAGMLLAAYWLDGPEMTLARPAFSSVTAFRWLIGVGVVMTITQSMRPWFLAASMSGASRFRENLDLVPSILSSTHQGLLWKLNMSAMLALIAVVAWMLRRRTRTTYLAAVICLCIVAFVKAASSHAGDDGDFTRLEMVQWLHILATAIWGGGVIVSGLIVLPALTRTAANATMRQYVQRLSMVATYAVITVLGAGIYSADREIAGPITSLSNSNWGKILIVKITVVFLALILGAFNRFICLGTDVTEEKITLSCRLLWIEAVAILAVFCLSGWLGNTAPE